jgi:hypothetical protein
MITLSCLSNETGAYSNYLTRNVRVKKTFGSGSLFILQEISLLFIMILFDKSSLSTTTKNTLENIEKLASA